MRVFSALAVLAAAACLSLGCHLISGVGDLQFADTGGAGGSGGHAHTTTTSSSALGGGGQGGATGGTGTCLAALQDGFDGGSLDTGLWVESLTSATSDVTSGVYALQPSGLIAGAWGQIISVNGYDVTSCAVLVQLVQALNNDGDAATLFTISSGGWQDSVGFRVSAGELRSRVMEASVETSFVTTPYDAGQQQWLRLREDAGTLYFETSPDGSSWTEQFNAPTPSYIAQAYVTLAAGSWAGTAVTPGEAQFDNVDLAP
jgi:hypothetical protein